jgi:hypothetical protein
MPITNSGSARCASNKLPDRQIDQPIMIARLGAIMIPCPRARKP